MSKAISHNDAAKQIIEIDNAIAAIKKAKCLAACSNEGNCLECLYYIHICTKLNEINSVVAIACK